MRFTAPKHIGTKPFYNFRRIPRKKKKQLKKLGFDFLDLNQKLWYSLEFTNKAYRNFLIQELIKIDNENIQNHTENLN